MGFFGGLALLFIALKLTGVVSWSWLWVLAPLWTPFVFAAVFVVVFVALALFAEYRKEREAQKRALRRYR